MHSFLFKINRNPYSKQEKCVKNPSQLNRPFFLVPRKILFFWRKLVQAFFANRQQTILKVLIAKCVCARFFSAQTHPIPPSWFLVGLDNICVTCGKIALLLSHLLVHRFVCFGIWWWVGFSIYMSPTHCVSISARGREPFQIPKTRPNMAQWKHSFVYLKK